MGKPKVTYFGEVLIDLTEDTVDAAHLVKGYTAPGADGEPVVGEYEGRTLPALSNPAGAGQIVSGYDAIDESGAKVTGTFEGQTKSATPGVTQQSISPDAGKYLSKVTVEAVPTETKSVAPSKTSQEVTSSAGKFMTKVTVSAIPYSETQLENGGTAVTIGA